MKEEYQITDRKDSRALAQFLSREGQALLPWLELIEQAEMAVDELINVAGRLPAVRLVPPFWHDAGLPPSK